MSEIDIYIIKTKYDIITKLFGNISNELLMNDNPITIFIYLKMWNISMKSIKCIIL